MKIDFSGHRRTIALCLLAGIAGLLPAPGVGEEERKPDSRPELWFPVGERLEYRIFWGVVPVGEAVMTTEWVNPEGAGGRSELLAIRLEATSNRVIEAIYPMNIQVESLIDPHTFLPVRYTHKSREGRRRKHEITEFDHKNGVAHWKSLTEDSAEEFELEENTRDLVSFAYYMRKKGFEKGERTHHRVMADDKIYDLWMESVDTERIRLRQYGRIPSTEVVPEAAFEGVFRREGKITFWVSRDDRQLLTRMDGSIPVASVRLLLERVRGPGSDDWPG